MIERTELLPGVTLRVFPDNRFKQNVLTVQFVRPMCKAEAALNALLPAVLLRGCESAPDLRAITLRLDDLYGASVSALVRRVGDYQTTGFSCGFICDGFALEGDRVLAPMVDFVRQLLLEPLTENGAFRPDFVESEKKNLIAAIEAQKNEKRTYCLNQMLEKMCQQDSYGVPRLGSSKDVAAITPESLYAHYQKLLAQSRVDICYVGQGDQKALAESLRAVFAPLCREVAPLPPQTGFTSCGGGNFTEEMDIAQGKLCVGYATPVNLRGGDLAAMQVCNVLYGGGMTSKLFMNVREKMSLCYDIGSAFYGSKGMMTVSAGIDCDKKDTVLTQLAAQLQDICQEKITQEELCSAKEALLSGLRGTHDTASSIEHYYATAALSGLGMTPTEYMDQIAQVDIPRVAAVARTLRQDTVYFLKGVG